MRKLIILLWVLCVPLSFGEVIHIQEASISVPDGWLFAKDNILSEITVKTAGRLNDTQKLLTPKNIFYARSSLNPPFSAIAIVKISAPFFHENYARSVSREKMQRIGLNSRNLIINSLANDGFTFSNWGELEFVKLKKHEVLFRSYTRVHETISEKVLEYTFFGSGAMYSVSASTSLSMESALLQLNDIVESFDC